MHIVEKHGGVVLDSLQMIPRSVSTYTSSKKIENKKNKRNHNCKITDYNFHTKTTACSNVPQILTA
jgi:hypothetical protein